MLWNVDVRFAAATGLHAGAAVAFRRYGMTAAILRHLGVGSAADRRL